MKHINFIEEENYYDTMINLVRPQLEHSKVSGLFKSFDEKEIYYEYYECQNEKGAIVISHGFCEFSVKFEEVIYYFHQIGYGVYILDHRGHGYSYRETKDLSMVHIRSYDEYVDDLHCFIKHFVIQPGKHRFMVLYGHSMGGAIAALYLERYTNIFDCAILSSPMLQMNFGKLPAGFARLILSIMKSLRSEKVYAIGQGTFDSIPLFESSSCLSKERYDYIFSKRMENERYQTYGASCGWAIESLKAINKLQKNAKVVKTPLLLFQAGKDSTVKAGGQRRFTKKTKNTLLVKIPGSKHEIYNASTDILSKYFEQIFSFMEHNRNTKYM